MSQKVKVSIIIPVYQVAPYIADCLHSVMAQTWQGPLECILVDDCGTDDSMAVADQVLKDYQGPITFRTVRHEHNRGLSAARNTGIEAALGDYVYFLDSDDEITPDCIARLATPLERASFDLVMADYRIIGTGMVKPPLLLADGAVLQGGDVLHAYRRGEWYMMSVNKLYQLSFLNRHHLRFREGIIHEDELWSFQIACLAQSLCAVASETYIYKLRQGSITVAKNHERRCECIRIILREMSDFAMAHGLYQHVDVYNLIQNFRMTMLYSVRLEAPALFARFYGDLRREADRSWAACMRMDGFDVRKQVRDLHFALPQCLAVPYLRLLLRFL